MRKEIKLDITRPPEEVFTLFLDPARRGEWIQGLTACSFSSQKAPEGGDKFTMTVDGRQEEEFLSVVEKPGLIVAVRRGPDWEVNGDYRFDATDAGTRVTFRGELFFNNWLNRIVSSVLSNGALDRVEQDLRRLKAVMEKS